MKLVEILVRDFEEWPKDAPVKSITQDNDRAINLYSTDRPAATQCGGCWESEGFIEYLTRSNTLASDHKTAIVTREMWQAERERIAKPGKKANAEGWVRHRGGKCPVYGNEVVVVKFRDGSVKPPARACAWAWHHTKDVDDIMRYKIQKPVEKQAPEIKVTHIDGEAGVIHAASVSSSCGPITLDWQEVQPITAATKRAHPVDDCEPDPSQQSAPIVINLRDPHPENPLIWRDRIREIGRTVEALEEERVSLIQRLEGEGFRLIGVQRKPERLLEWQRYAIDGMKINAIKEYRNLTGVSLREAKDAVEAYQESQD